VAATRIERCTAFDHGLSDGVTLKKNLEKLRFTNHLSP
jgi:hypothetical protein